MIKKALILIIYLFISVQAIGSPSGKIQFQGAITSNACDIFNENTGDEKCQNISQQTGVQQLNDANTENMTLNDANKIVSQSQQSEQVTNVALQPISTKENLGIIVVTYK